MRRQKFTDALLNAISSAAALLNERGDILTVNKVWGEAASESPFFGSEFSGRNYFDVLANEAKSGSDFGLKMILGLRSVIDKKSDEFSLAYSVYQNDSVNWYKVNIIRNDDDDEEEHLIFVKHEKWIDSYAMKDAFLLNSQNSLPTYLGSWFRANPRRKQAAGTADELAKPDSPTAYESELEKSLYEKEILLQEVHHRVKNNLAVISGLIELQVMDSGHQELTQKLKHVQNRILSIAQIHESIYQNGNLAHVEMDSYFRRFAEHMSYTDDEEYVLELNLEPVHVHLNLAVPLGLLINELMLLISQGSDCNKHKVTFSMCQVGDRVLLDMYTDCLQFESINDFKEETQFNLKIIHVLLQQLDATFEFSNSKPKSLKISFKNTNVRGSSSMLY